jgi:hypothetical protein
MGCKKHPSFFRKTEKVSRVIVANSTNELRSDKIMLETIKIENSPCSKTKFENSPL